jgi:hypothetical protein
MAARPPRIPLDRSGLIPLMERRADAGGVYHCASRSVATKVGRLEGIRMKESWQPFYA